ncbi:MAG: hypothetical protein LQ348_006229 [Seirophora lacunosa]|nr:MAG: hypothetical protein LQ348_006229 [Seirophora lacunosa]
MKQIYTQAQWVLIWLGSDPDGDAHLAFDLAANIAESCCRVLRINISDVARINVRQALDHVGGKISSNIEQDLNMWRAIQKLYMRPWFRRIWVIQEAQSAKPERARVMLGDLQIDFDILAVAACWMDWCNANELQTGPLGGKIANVNSAVIKRGPYLDTISFQTLLHHTRVYESSDPRDKIYAVLGFSASQKVSSRIRPNYTMSAANVYLDVSKALIESGQGIDVLSFVRHGTTVSKDLPSWVCIFEYESEFVLAWIPYFKAGGSIIYHLPTVSNRVLAIEAFEFGKINTVERALRHASGPVLTEDDHHTLITILRSMQTEGAFGPTFSIPNTSGVVTPAHYDIIDDYSKDYAAEEEVDDATPLLTKGGQTMSDMIRTGNHAIQDKHILNDNYMPGGFEDNDDLQIHLAPTPTPVENKPRAARKPDLQEENILPSRVTRRRKKTEKAEKHAKKKQEKAEKKARGKVYELAGFK